MKQIIISAVLALTVQFTFAQASHSDSSGMNQTPNHSKAQNSVADLKQNGNTIDYANRQQAEMKSADVPANVSGTFKQKYPNQNEVTWYKGESGYTANYLENNTHQQVLYDMNGKMMGTGAEVKSSMLPESTTTYLKRNYPDAQYEQVYKITPITGDAYYQVYVNGKWVKFDSKGNYAPMK